MGKTDWNRLQNMTEEAITQNALVDPGAQPTSKEVWNNAYVVMPDNEPKVSITSKV